MRGILVAIGIILAFFGVIFIIKKDMEKIGIVSLAIGIVSFLLSFVFPEPISTNFERTKIEKISLTENSVTGSDIDQRNVSINSLEDDIKNAKVSINDIKTINGSFVTYNDLIEDVFGNEYDDYVEGTATVFDNVIYEEYVTNKMFNTFSGTLFMWEKSSKPYRMKVLINGKEVYKSKKITKKTEPIDFNIDISNSDIVKVEFVTDGGTGYIANGYFE